MKNLRYLNGPTLTFVAFNAFLPLLFAGHDAFSPSQFRAIEQIGLNPDRAVSAPTQLGLADAKDIDDAVEKVKENLSKLKVAVDEDKVRASVQKYYSETSPDSPEFKNYVSVMESCLGRDCAAKNFKKSTATKMATAELSASQKAGTQATSPASVTTQAQEKGGSPQLADKATAATEAAPKAGSSSPAVATISPSAHSTSAAATPLDNSASKYSAYKSSLPSAKDLSSALAAAKTNPSGGKYGEGKIIKSGDAYKYQSSAGVQYPIPNPVSKVDPFSANGSDSFDGRAGDISVLAGNYETLADVYRNPISSEASTKQAIENYVKDGISKDFMDQNDPKGAAALTLPDGRQVKLNESKGQYTLEMKDAKDWEIANAPLNIDPSKGAAANLQSVTRSVDNLYKSATATPSDGWSQSKDLKDGSRVEINYSDNAYAVSYTDAFGNSNDKIFDSSAEARAQANAYVSAHVDNPKIMTAQNEGTKMGEIYKQNQAQIDTLLKGGAPSAETQAQVQQLQAKNDRIVNSVNGQLNNGGDNRSPSQNASLQNSNQVSQARAESFQQVAGVAPSPQQHSTAAIQQQNTTAQANASVSGGAPKAGAAP